jgi:hypothetical protein
MPKDRRPHIPGRFKPGDRVTRKDTQEQGTVVDSPSDDTKVKWDGGRTSYFKAKKPGNVTPKKK